LKSDFTVPIAAFSYLATRNIQISTINIPDAGIYNLILRATKTIGGTIIADMPFTATLIDPC
jgi:hypothetical protein